MSKLPDFEAWAIFARVAETGSFARAADELELSKATVSKAVSRLEARLGASLFHRTSRRLSLTESGRNALERANRILAEGEAVEAETAAQSVIPRGVVRLAAPVSFGLLHMADILPDFLARYPEVTLDVNLADHKVDLVAEGYDLAIRIGALSDSSLIARRIAAVRKLLVGSPDLVARVGAPARPTDLSGRPVLHYGTEQWRFRAGARWETARVKPVLRSNNGEMLREAAVAGVGFCILPSFIAAPALEAGRLEVVMPDYPLEEAALHAVMPPGRAVTARVRALIDFLVSRFGPEPAWDPCWRAGTGSGQG